MDITEAEALEKWCPIAMGRDRGTRCAGSDCMAWRFTGYKPVAGGTNDEAHGRCDLFPGMEPDGCVIDSGRIDYCRPAQVLVAEGKTKADCEYWLPVNKAPSI